MAKKDKKIVNATALTMEDLLKMESSSLSSFKKGQEVKGKITSIKNKSIFIDIGGKTDAVVMGKEFEFVKDYVADLKLGDEIEVQIKSPENDKGQILVSIRGAASGYGWNYFKDKEKSGGEITVFAKELNRGGAVVVAPFGFFGFIPGSQIGAKYDGDPDKMIGKKIKVKVLEVDQAKNRLVFSERLVSEPDKVGEEVGAIENLEGLVHISEISWEKVSDLSTMFRAKDKVKIKLINKDDGRLQFSIKRLSDDPWTTIEEKYPKDKEVDGEVVRIANFGALVKLETGVEGLIHISKLTGGVSLKEGEKVQVYIESIDVQKRKISLGIVETSKKNVIYK